MRVLLGARAAAAALAAATLPWSTLASAADATPADATVAELLAHAERAGPLNLVARARLGRGQAAVAAAAPRLIYNPQWASQVGLRSGGGSAAGADFEVSLSQPLEVAGEPGLRRQAAQQQAALGRAEAAAAAWTVHRAVHHGCNEVLAAQVQVALARAAAASAEASAALWAQRASAGEEPPLAAWFGQVEVAQARQGVHAAEAALAQATLTLKEVAGWPGDQPLAVRGALPTLQAAPPLAELLQRAREGNPALRSAVAAEAAARAQWRLEDRTAAPTPAIGVRYAKEAGGGGATQVLQATLGLALPLWNANRPERLRAQAEAQVAMVERQVLERGLAYAVARAHAAVQAALARAEATQGLLGPSFQHQLQLLERAHQLGEIDALQLGQARSRLWHARQQAVSAHLDYARSLADLEAILGQEIWPTKVGGP